MSCPADGDGSGWLLGEVAVGSDWLLGEEAVEPGLVVAEHKCRSRGFIHGGEGNHWQATHRSEDWTSGRLVLEDRGLDFTRLHIADTGGLEEHGSRQSCERCNKSRKYFCYTCCLPLASIKHITPRVELPVRVEIVKHPGEVAGKSTAVHAAVLAPDMVSLHTHPSIPSYPASSTLLVFPGPTATSLPAIVQRCREGGGGGVVGGGGGGGVFPFKTIVFVDSTWNQCHGICQDPRLRLLPTVMIEARSTVFWRNQKGKSAEHLATIEAIYYFMVDYHTHVLGQEYRGEYDNLLFFFKFMHHKIHQLYSPPAPQ